MSSRFPFPRRASAAAAIEKAAGEWLARRDRGLTPAEMTALAEWQAADPRHAAELARLSETWASLDTADEVPGIMTLAGEVDSALAQRVRRRARRPWLFGALAAGLAIAAFWSAGLFPRPGAAPTYRVIPSNAQQLTLADGTIVELNANSAVEPAFTAHERRVRLVRGEAHFAVVKDPARPFVVEARSIAVRAVGTAFNVRLDPAAVQLLVTEGKVRVENVVPPVAVADSVADSAALSGDGRAATPTPAGAATTPLVTAGERLVVDSTPAAPDLSRVRVEAVLPEELERSLAWKRPQLIFDRTPLPEAIAAFNRFNRHQLTIGDGALAKRHLGGAFQADNVEGFVHVLETGFDVIAERRSAGETVLRQTREK